MKLVCDCALKDDPGGMGTWPKLLLHCRCHRVTKHVRVCFRCIDSRVLGPLCAAAPVAVHTHPLHQRTRLVPRQLRCKPSS